MISNLFVMVCATRAVIKETLDITEVHVPNKPTVSVDVKQHSANLSCLLQTVL